MTRQRGAALLMVLWMVLLLAGLVAGYALTARVESMQGNGEARTVQASAAARAGIEFAAARMLDPDSTRRWAADGRSYPFAFDGAQVEVRVRDEAAKVDLNAASYDLLRSLLEAVGEPKPSAAKLAGAVLDWRDQDSLAQVSGGGEDADYAAAGLAWGAKDAPFETVAELEQVIGMRPQLFAALAPHLTIYSGREVPDAEMADAVVRRALGQPPRTDAQGASMPVLPGSGTYSIDSRAQLANGRRAHLSVVLRMGASRLPGSTYTVLSWTTMGAER